VEREGGSGIWRGRGGGWVGGVFDYFFFPLLFPLEGREGMSVGIGMG